MYLNINDFSITLIIAGNELIIYWLSECYFFTKNIKNIRKVIKSYQQKTFTDNYNVINQK